MKKYFRMSLHVLALSGGILLGGCAATKTGAPLLYDLGPLHSMQTGGAAPAGLPPFSIAEVNAPAWLDSPMMYFRLAYANDQQPRPYAGSRWTMPPAQLFGQRLKSRLAEAGGVVLSLGDGTINVPLLRIDTDDFTQNFTSPGQSSTRIAVRATVFNGRTLLAQKTFVQQTAAPDADAAGGVRAFATGVDNIIADMMAWLAALPVKK